VPSSQQRASLLSSFHIQFFRSVIALKRSSGGENMLCRYCGSENKKTAKFCNECGSFIGIERDFSISQLKNATQFIPDALSNRITSSRASLRDEIKHVTVLFSDISDSTALIDGLSPEESLHILEPVLNSLVEAAHSYGGVVVRIQGDGILALFGAPIALEDHALRACQASLAMQEAISSGDYGDVKIHIGLNSGEVLVRSVNTDLSMDYDAVGTTVHLGARMEQRAPPGAILLTENTLRLAGEFLKVSPLGATALKGIKAPIGVFQLDGFAPPKTRWDVRVAKGLTGFVGRQSETTTLTRAMTSAQRGEGQVITVCGEPGVGKSRLVHELMFLEKSRSWTTLECAGVSSGKQAAYYPISELMRSWFQLGSGDSHGIIKKKMSDRLYELDKGLLRNLPALQSLLDIPVEDAHWNGLDPFQRRRMIMESIRSVMLKWAEERPIILLFEDLQWMDEQTLALLEKIASDIEHSKMLLLLTHRPEFQCDWNKAPNFNSIRIEPLDGGSADHMLSTLLGNHPDLVSLKRQLVDRTQGTPLFLEEMVRTVIETEIVDGEPGDYRLGRNPEKLEIPETVRSVITARIDRLAPEYKSLLQTVAVVGQDVSETLIQGMTGEPAGALTKRLSELQASGFLFQTRNAPERELAFTHELTREVAYESILETRRRQLHALIVNTIETQHADRLDQNLDRLAHHTIQGALWEKAITYHLKACNRAILRSANAEAVSLYRNGLKALNYLPKDSFRDRAAIDLRLIVIAAYIPLGELDKMIGALDEARVMAESIQDRRRLALVNTHLSTVWWIKGDHKRGLEAGKRAYRIATEIGHPELQFAAQYNIGMAYQGVGEYAKVVEYLERLHQVLEGDLKLNRAGWPAYPFVFIQTFLASAYIELGNFEAAEKHIHEGRDFANKMNHPYSLAMIYDYSGYFLLRSGDTESAVDVLERALDICAEYDIANLEKSITAKLGLAHALSGSPDLAIARLENTIRPDGQKLRGGSYIWLWLYLALGEAYLAAGRTQDADVQVTKALELTRETKEIPHQAYALKLQGDICCRLGGEFKGKAAISYREAIQLAESCGMRPLVAHCHRELGRLLMEDEETNAAGEFRTAKSIFDELKLTSFSKVVDGDLALLA